MGVDWSQMAQDKDNEPLDSIKVERFVKPLSDCHLKTVLFPGILGSLNCAFRLLSYHKWYRRQRTKPLVEACAGPGLALGPWPDLARGPGLVAQIMFGSGPYSDDGNQTTQNISGFLGPSFFASKKLFVATLILCLWQSRAAETNPTDLIFSGIL
jgi:hypothetical protein